MYSVHSNATYSNRHLHESMIFAGFPNSTPRNTGILLSSRPVQVQSVYNRSSDASLHVRTAKRDRQHRLLQALQGIWALCIFQNFFKLSINDSSFLA